MASRQVVRGTIRLVGADRCMFGSSFPVDSLCASFKDISNGFANIVAGMSAAEWPQIFHDNALRLYDIGR